MHIPRIYYPQPLQPSQKLVLDSQASTHLLRVLRLKNGAPLRIFNGNGQEYTAILSHDKHPAVVLTTEPYDNPVESPLHIHLGQGISRGDKMDYTIQKAVELGVTSITPLFTQYSGVNLRDDRLRKRWQHWQAVAISACEQCGRNVLPVIAAPLAIDEWLSQCRQTLRLVLQPQGDKQLRDFTATTEVALLTGPEGGLSTEELANAARFDFSALRLGPRVLRTETTAPAAIAILQALWGDM